MSWEGGDFVHSLTWSSLSVAVESDAGNTIPLHCWTLQLSLGKTVVTGASDGIGLESALPLAKAGFNVLLVACNRRCS